MRSISDGIIHWGVPVWLRAPSIIHIHLSCFPCSFSTYVQSLQYIAYFYIRWNLYIMYFSATCFFPTNILFLSFIHFIVCSCIYWLYSVVQLYCIFFVQSIGDGLSGLFPDFFLVISYSAVMRLIHVSCAHLQEFLDFVSKLCMIVRS